MKKLLLLLTLFLLCSCAHSPHPWTKQEKVLLLPSAMTVVTDYITTKNGLKRGGREMNPYMSNYPSDEELFIKGIFAYGTILAIAHFFPDWRGEILGFQIGWCSCATMFDYWHMGK